MEGLELIKYRGARKVMETLLEFKGRQFTVNELSKTSKVPFASVWRIIKLWESAGIVETNIVGKSRIVKLKMSEYTKNIVKLLSLSKSPQALTTDALGKELRNKKIEEAYLFGSVAKGKEKLESDIDLAILQSSEIDTNKIIFDIYEKYGTKIVPLIFKNKKEFDKFLRDKEKRRII